MGGCLVRGHFRARRRHGNTSKSPVGGRRQASCLESCWRPSRMRGRERENRNHGWKRAESDFEDGDEVLGQPDELVFRTNFVDTEPAQAIRTLVETGRFHGEFTYRRGDGKRIHIDSHAAAFFDSEGKRLGYVSVNRDITERGYAEEAIRALLREVLTAQEVERRRSPVSCTTGRPRS